MIIPTHLQIETINGVCTARCTMCSYKSWTRKPHCMEFPMFCDILDKFYPYRKKLQFLSLQGFGETLLDHSLIAKITMAKDMGFSSVGFATNCTELTARMSERLLNAGLDTIICSVDGVTAETHEKIRVKTVFSKVVKNIETFLNIRSIGDGHTKVIIRFIRQMLNAHEWDDFKAYWEGRLDKKYGDAVISFDIVDCDGKVEDYNSKDVLSKIEVPCVCDQLYNRMIVLSNGDVALCCGDDNGKFNIGNVLKDDPIKIYNGEVFTRYRTMMKAGMVRELDLCNTCTIPRSQQLKDKV